MGTNFYWRIETAPDQTVTLPTGEEITIASRPYDGWDDPKLHIGKRSGAGPYCWDCRRTLCPGGESMVHKGGLNDPLWPDECSCCGKKQKKESLSEGAAGIELGFAKPRSVRPTGVQSCSSFSWAQNPGDVRALCIKHEHDQIVMNEYGDMFTGSEFLEMLDCNCPIEFFHHIGRRFS